MKKILKNKKIIIIVSILLLLIIIGLILLTNKNKTKEYTNDKYYILYDNTWSLKTHKDDTIVLKHSKGTITIKIEDLGERKYLEIDNLIDDIRYNIEENNDHYKLLSREKTIINKGGFEGYSFLYENDSNDVKVCVYKVDDKLITTYYEADIDYYDLLLDSANNIIYNFNLKDEEYSLGDTIDIQTSEIKYGKYDYKDLDKKYNDEIATSNYLVNYDIPNAFQRTNISTDMALYTYSGLNDTNSQLKLDVNIDPHNIYNYLTASEEEYFTLKANYKNERKESNFEESLDIYNKDASSYIYKNSYESKGYDGEVRKYENVEIIYPAGNRHIIIFKIHSTNVSITKDLIDSIKVNEIKNYYHYTKNEVIDNKIVFNMKFKSILDLSIYEIKASVPIDYMEANEFSSINLYESRYFVKNYDDSLGIYKNQIKYGLIANNEKTAVENENNMIALSTDSSPLKAAGNITIGDKTFNVYKAKYQKKSTSLYSKLYNVSETMLIYQVSSDRVLSVIIKDIDSNDITNEEIKKLVSFEVEKKEM